MTASAPELPAEVIQPSFRQRLGHFTGSVLGWVLYRLWRAVTYPFRGQWRALRTAWLVGFFMVGNGASAYADGLILGPDLAKGAELTVFERIPLGAYDLPLQLSEDHHGTPWVEEGMWNILNGVGNTIMYVMLALVKGAIVCMQWMLQLNFYEDNRSAIDSAVQSLARGIFWPLFGATLAVAATAMYAQMKKEGSGSALNEMVWIVAASAVAVSFATAPSKIAYDLDSVRRAVTSGIVEGYAEFPTASVSSAGFAEVAVPATSAGAVRKVSDSMWNVYAVTPWCYAAWNDPAICFDVGKDYLTRYEPGQTRWNEIYKEQGDESSYHDNDTCQANLAPQCDWIRGQSFARLGGVAFVALLAIPLAAMLITLALFGIMALVGFALMLLVGLLFLLGWMIKGRARQMGIRWFEALIGTVLQNIIVTAVIGSVMVMGAMLNQLIPSYGLFMVAALNIAVFIVGLKIRGQFESISGLSSPVSQSPISSYMATSLLRGASRFATKLPGRAVSGGKNAWKAGGAAKDYVKNVGGNFKDLAGRAGVKAPGLKNFFQPGNMFASAQGSRHQAAPDPEPLKAIGPPMEWTGPQTPTTPQLGGGGPRPNPQLPGPTKRPQLPSAPSSQTEERRNAKGGRTFVDGTGASSRRVFQASAPPPSEGRNPMVFDPATVIDAPPDRAHAPVREVSWRASADGRNNHAPASIDSTISEPKPLQSQTFPATQPSVRPNFSGAREQIAGHLRAAASVPVEPPAWHRPETPAPAPPTAAGSGRKYVPPFLRSSGPNQAAPLPGERPSRNRGSDQSPKRRRRRDT